MVRRNLEPRLWMFRGLAWLRQLLCPLPDGTLQEALASNQGN